MALTFHQSAVLSSLWLLSSIISNVLALPAPDPGLIYGSGDKPTAVPYTNTYVSSTSIATIVHPTVLASSAARPNPQGSAGTAVNLPSGWTYRGCYVDNLYGHILAVQEPSSNTLTIESCISTCMGLGYTVAGAEYATQCSCGNEIIEGGAPASADTQCNMACGGNTAEACGAGNRMSVYATGTLMAIPPAAPQTSGLPGSWAYQGCITEGLNGARVFPYQLILTNNNSATNCLTQCSNFGFGAGGMEYSSECYCGDSSNVIASGSTVAASTDCNQACSGAPSYICGGGNRLSYYTWTGNLNTWSYASGINAGQYQFFDDGVVVPLITTQGINGKITFLEKFGTSQQPNSTGAYEMDPSLVTAAGLPSVWRTMHVKTDVFCSAGLVLPDKAGRVLNVGGWSLDSTYGVRLYWPDGSPGVAGVNDWQENESLLHLQSGRWYPSAMVMANGSVMVIGGENGSNGPPVPSLEILPTPAGGNTTVYLDFLRTTDPNNLYPYTAVLPSGGIFIVYYNQARILNPTTFATIKTFPQIPGAVNNFQGGRSYPFEGTSIMLPQHAPYTDLVTVLVCGGSTPGAAVALDNCVSTQPDATNPTWTLERMPSKRVMTCIAPLPDGTMLIVNGAMQGVAGFGLATLPNLNAILYDPSKPVNSRFTVMANTTIARLYHSEALLLQDGRVLISGSDPEDGKNPQEYRVEVFVPPYLLAGLKQPTYTIKNTQWTYGQANPITVTLFQGTTATMRVSLLGATSSTHGNSMGQRTFFPAFSCSGTTCTITAPPNANVCPPGWFQLWVLDGPTPSVSQWVRIGGDPAGLGKWPAITGFTVPGV